MSRELAIETLLSCRQQLDGLRAELEEARSGTSPGLEALPVGGAEFEDLRKRRAEEHGLSAQVEVSGGKWRCSVSVCAPLSLFLSRVVAD